MRHHVRAIALLAAAHHILLWFGALAGFVLVAGEGTPPDSDQALRWTLDHVMPVLGQPAFALIEKFHAHEPIATVLLVACSVGWGGVIYAVCLALRATGDLTWRCN